MSGPNPMLGPSLNLSGILPPGGLMSTMQPAPQTGRTKLPRHFETKCLWWQNHAACRSLIVMLIVTPICLAGTPFGLNNSAGLRPLNLLQVKLCSSEPVSPLVDGMHSLLYLIDTLTHWHIATPGPWVSTSGITMSCVLVHSSTVLLTSLLSSTSLHKACSDQLRANCSRSDIPVVVNGPVTLFLFDCVVNSPVSLCFCPRVHFFPVSAWLLSNPSLILTPALVSLPWFLCLFVCVCLVSFCRIFRSPLVLSSLTLCSSSSCLSSPHSKVSQPPPVLNSRGRR